ncbi:MAG TPA: DUF1003 domain-containing protein [Flavobacterium sp.]|nr:DUF1003 domain-containing protein [Flavobacterium sp.]
METNNLDDLLEVEDRQLKKLHKIVADTIREEKLITGKLLHEPSEMLTIGQRVSDRIARFGGSWKFIIWFGVSLAIWIAFNAAGPGQTRFDPYPFILLNLILSCIAALQAPIIMMSQNRQEEKDRMRSENDYLVNLKAEMEIRRLHQKMDLLLEEHLKTLYESQSLQMKILNELKEKLAEHENNDRNPSDPS